MKRSSPCLPMELDRKRFLDIAELAGTWVWETDAELRFSHLSDRFYEIFSLVPEAIIGQSITEIVRPQELDTAWRVHLKMMDRRSAFSDFRYVPRLPNGDVRHVRISGRPMFDDGGIFLGYRGTGTDITAQVSAEHKASEAHRRLVDAIEALREGFALYDADDRLVICNSRYKNFFPVVTHHLYEPGHRFEDIVRAGVKMGLSVDGVKRGEAWVQQRVADHRAPRPPFERELSDGRWLLAAEYKTRDGGLVSVHTDITEMKEKERQLGEKSALLETALDNMGCGMSMIDADLKLVAINQEFIDLMNFPPELTKPGVAFEKLIRFNAENGVYGPGDVDELVLDRVNFVSRFEAHRFERVRPDGKVIEIVGNPMPGGGFVRTYTDVTERHRAARDLRASNDRYSGILNIAEDAVISIDETQRITLFNRGARKVFGYDEAEIIGQPLDVLIPPRYRDAHGGHLKNFSTSSGVSRRMTQRAEIVGLRKDGREFPAEASISRLQAGGETTFTVMLRDISERKLAAAEREELREQFHRAQRLEAMGTLAGGMAHDFNNVLVSILGYTDLSLESLAADHPVSAHLRQVEKAARRATALIQDMLDFSRRRDQGKAPVCLEGVFGEAVALVRAALAKRIALEHEIDGEVGSVLASETAMHQVIMNLCVNAGQAIGDQAGKVSLSLANVDLSAAEVGRLRRPPSRAAKSNGGASRHSMCFGNLPAGSYVRLSVRDTGCGMDQTTLSRAFEPFFTNRPAGGGSGLGLASVHGIVTAHGGAITVESEPGKGTTFQVFLERLDDSAVAAAASRGGISRPAELAVASENPAGS